jgi:hypothetical protein
LIRSVTVFLGLILLPGFGSETVNFDALKPGMMPPYWTATSSHSGAASHWEVKRDPRAPTRQNVLAQTAAGSGDSDYPLAIYDRTLSRDGDLSVKFKITGGQKAKTAGIVWRYQDQNNYYLLSFSADEGKIALFRVQDGRPRAIPILGVKGGATFVRHDIRLDQWYLAKVTYQGTRLRVSFGNRRLFDAVDDGIGIQGKTGLCTRAGTMAEFDDFRLSRKS